MLGAELNGRACRDAKGANLQLIKVPTDDEKSDIALQKKDNVDKEGTLGLDKKARFLARGARDGESDGEKRLDGEAQGNGDEPHP